jgi:membrane fusion protein (multidrug efflux system)
MKNLIILIILIAAGCSGNKQAQVEALKAKRDKINRQIEQLETELAASSDSTAVNAKSTFVSVEDVTPTDFNHFIEVQGKLDGDQNIAIYPETAGNVNEVYAHVGKYVNKDEVLATVNDASFQEQLKSLETNFKLASETFQKQENLWKQQIGSEMQYLQAKANKESLESQLAALKEQIDMTRIKSPINGNVEESMIKVGQSVSPSMPAFRVVNFNDLKVTADVAEAYAAKIKTGDEVIIYLPDIQKELKAKVTFTSKYVNPVNRTYLVEARLSNRVDNMKANMVAILKIRDYYVPKALVLPVNLVQTDNNGQYVLIAHVENDQYFARKQLVKTGQIYNGVAEIVTGLEPGQKVITGGYLNLDEGEPVRF